ncbi:MAG: type IV secretion protein IcmC [Legionella sp.]|nr:MAG: type IV secretion protein IcmC [Legionella sp.]
MIDLITMIGNLSKTLPSVQTMLGGLSYLLGIIFVMAALARFRQNVDKGAQGGGKDTKMIVPFSYLFVGAILFFLPTTMHTFSNTLFGSGTSVLQYSDYQPYDIYNSITLLVETVGLVWFIRGCVLLAHASHPEQGQEGSKGFGHKGLLFIIAGLFGINFQSTVNMMNSVMTYLINLTVTSMS